MPPYGTSITASSGPGARNGTSSIRRSPAAWATTAGPEAGRFEVVHQTTTVIPPSMKIVWPLTNVGAVRGQPDHRTGEVLHGSPAVGRGPAEDPGVECGVVHQVLGHFGVDVAGCDAVDLQPVRCPLGRHGAGEVAQSALRRHVRGDGGPGEVGLDRADVDDLAASARESCGGRLPGPPGTRWSGPWRGPVPVGDVQVQHGHPVLDAGVVHQDVQRADVFLDPGDAAFGSVVVRDVEGAAVRSGPADSRRPAPSRRP